MVYVKRGKFEVKWTGVKESVECYGEFVKECDVNLEVSISIYHVIGPWDF